VSIAALIELREKDRMRGIDPAAFDRAPDPPAPPPSPPLRIDPPDWHAEQRDRAARRDDG
jgi:hypothetical protein